MKEGKKNKKTFIINLLVVAIAFFVVGYFIGGNSLLSDNSLSPPPEEELFSGESGEGGPVIAPLVAPVCGNGIFTSPKECEDCNTINNDGCSSTCKEEYCGDGILQTGEVCDVPNLGCQQGMVCDVENFCSRCINAQGQPPVVSATATPKGVYGSANVRIDYNVVDPDDFVTHYKTCSGASTQGCRGGGSSGGGCTNWNPMPPSYQGLPGESFSSSYNRQTYGGPMTLTETIYFKDRAGNVGSATANIANY
jgi:cysteine-rich repeat protein